jgi:hypothetical protein
MFADYPQEPFDGSIPSEPWMEVSEPILSEYQATAPIPTSVESLTAGFDLGSNWPMMAIIGVGVLIALRGKKKEPHARRRSRRKR